MQLPGHRVKSLTHTCTRTHNSVTKKLKHDVDASLVLGLLVGKKMPSRIGVSYSVYSTLS